MKVAITGGTGFLGAEIARLHLAQGDEIRILSRHNGLYQADLTSPAADLAAFVSGVDILYHCAGEIRDPALMQALHVEGTARLIAAARGQVAHWVQISSVGAYGDRSEGIVTEATPTVPSGPYELTKTMADEAVLAAATAGAFGCTILRPSNVVGQAMRHGSVFELISAIAAGLFFFIGPPGAQTNYVHVANVAEAALCCGRRDPAEPRIYIVSDNCSFEEFAFGVADGLGRSRPWLRLPLGIARFMAQTAGRVRGFPLTLSRLHALSTRATYSTARLSTELGYRPPISMQQTIIELVTAWRHNGQA